MQYQSISLLKNSITSVEDKSSVVKRNTDNNKQNSHSLKKQLKQDALILDFEWVTTICECKQCNRGTFCRRHRKKKNCKNRHEGKGYNSW